MRLKYLIIIAITGLFSCSDEPKITDPKADLNPDSLKNKSPEQILPPADSTDPVAYASYLFALSEKQESDGDTSGAIQSLEKLVQPGEISQASLRLASLYAATLHPATISFCDRMIAANPQINAPEPHYFKGAFYDNRGESDKALKEFNTCIRVDYTFIDAYLEKGRILYNQKKYKEALGVYDLALKVSNSFADTYYWIGKCQEALGEKEEAILNFKRAFGLDKTLTEAREAAARLESGG